MTLAFSYRGFDEFKGIEIAWNKEKVGSKHLLMDEGGAYVKRLEAEAAVLRHIRHKHIIKIYDSWMDKTTNDVNFITEIFTSGNLREYVQTRPLALLY